MIATGTLKECDDINTHKGQLTWLHVVMQCGWCWVQAGLLAY